FIVADRIRRIVKQAIHRWRHPTYTMSPERYGSWTLPGYGDPTSPLGVEGGIALSVKNMQKLADLLAGHRITLVRDATLQRRSGEPPDRDVERILRQELSAIHGSVPGLLLRKGSARRLVRTPVHLWR